MKRTARKRMPNSSVVMKSLYLRPPMIKQPPLVKPSECRPPAKEVTAVTSSAALIKRPKERKVPPKDPPSSKCPDLSFTIDPNTCFGKALEPYSEDGRISGEKFREIESQHKRCTNNTCKAATGQE